MVVVISSGTFTVGGVVSGLDRVTVNVSVALLLLESLAVQVTVVVPSLKYEPLLGLQVTLTAPS